MNLYNGKIHNIAKINNAGEPVTWARMRTRIQHAHIYPVLMCEHVSNLAFRKEIIFCLIHYIQPSENTLFYTSHVLLKLKPTKLVVIDATV